MSKMLGGGSDRMNLKPLNSEGNRDGNDHPELDEMVGCHTGTSYGLNLGRARPGHTYVWERRKGPDILRSKQRGGTVVEKGDDDYPVSATLTGGLEPTSLDSGEIYEDLVLFRYPEEAVRQRREREQAKANEQLRSGAEEFVSQATQAEIEYSGGGPTRFAARRHRMDFRAGHRDESPLLDQWTPDKGIVDDG
jgi:hypothetical protein